MELVGFFRRFGLFSTFPKTPIEAGTPFCNPSQNGNPLQLVYVMTKEIPILVVEDEEQMKSGEV